MTYTSRAYAGDADYALLRAFLSETWGLAGPPDYATVGDLDWWRYTSNLPDVMSGVGLWLDADGALAGFVWHEPGAATLFSHPRHRALELELLDWSEARERARGGATLGVGALTTDTARAALLAARGYARSGHDYHYYLRALDADPPHTSLPPGFSVRHVRGAEDLEARVAVHRDAFAPSRMTVAKHQAVMAAPTYRPELDLVVEAPDGSFAAYCLVWFDAVSRHGVFEPVGCHSSYQRRGLASAVMREGLRRLRALGATSASVLANADRPAPNGLYASLGFQLLARDEEWTRAL